MYSLCYVLTNLSFVILCTDEFVGQSFVTLCTEEFVGEDVFVILCCQVRGQIFVYGETHCYIRQ